MIALTPVDAIPPEIRPFVEFKASLKKLEPKSNQMVAITLVESTSCYIPIFLDKEMTIEEIKEELAAQDAELSSASERAIAEYLEKQKSANNK